MELYSIYAQMRCVLLTCCWLEFPLSLSPEQKRLRMGMLPYCNSLGRKCKVCGLGEQYNFFFCNSYTFFWVVNEHFGVGS